MTVHRRSFSIHAALLGAALLVHGTGARAETDTPAIDPAAPHATGQVLTAGPAPRGPTLLMSGGYGYTESVLGGNDTHHRLAGALTIHERPVPWLDLALRLDGRYDAHVVPGQPTDTGMVGDPRLFVRVDQGWPGGLRLGARAGLWLPGRNAPSVDVNALSPELVGLASYVPGATPIALTANVGYRFDRSARSAPDAAQLGPGDRLALGVSAFDQVLVGLAATFGRGSAQGFVEAHADLLVGAGAPAPAYSPIFVGGGGRFAVTRGLRLEAAVEASPSSRPDAGPTAPLVPIPPRVAFWLGLAYGFGTPVAPPPSGSPPSPPPPPVTPAPAPVAPPPESVALAGRVAAADGGKLVDLRVEIVRGEASTEIAVDEGGRFTVEGKPGEELTVTAAAAGCDPERAAVTLAPGRPNKVAIALQRRLPQGQIRGLVRSMKGAAVAADIGIEPEAAGEPKRLRVEAGRFQVDVAPGRYRVTISAPGYQPQQRSVEVEDNGVTVLNVDLRSQR